MARIGVASTMTTLVAYMLQQKQRHAEPGHAGQRILWMVTMKFSPVRIELNPLTKTAHTASVTWVLEKAALYGV